MAKLKSVLANLKSTFEDYDFAFIEPVSYIKALSNETDKIIFVYKYCPSVNSPRDFSFRSEDPNKSANLDLTGSPLKDNVTIERLLDISLDLKLAIVNSWTAAEECYKPLRMEEARNIIQNALSLDVDATGSMWFLCDGDNGEHKVLLLQSEFNSIWNSRGIVSIDGIQQYNNIEINSMLERHFSTINSNELETQISSIYRIKRNISLQLDWSTTTLKPSLNTDKYADVTLKQSVKIGNDKNTSDYWSQIYLLNMIKEDIITYKMKESDRIDPEYRCGGNIDIKSIFDNIIQILTNADLSVSDGFNDNNYNNTLEGIIELTRNRKNLEVTDHLWDILRYCSSYQDLKNSLTFIFQTAAKSNISNLPTNSNRLSELIRDVARQRIAIPCLSGSQPLELLLEIGLERIVKDYELIFKQSKILDLNFSKMNINENQQEAPPNVRKSLHNAQRGTIHGNAANANERKTLLHNTLEKGVDASIHLGFQNSSFIESDVNFKLSKLAQVHLIMEHLLMIQINLNLENVYSSITQKLIQKPLIDFEVLRQAACDTIEIPIVHDKIITLVENIKPHTRRIHMKSENNSMRMENIFYHSMDPIFPPNVVEYFKIDDKVVSSNLYWCLHYMKIGTKRA